MFLEAISDLSKWKATSPIKPCIISDINPEKVIGKLLRPKGCLVKAKCP